MGEREPLDRVSYHELHTIFSNPDQPGTPVVRNGSPFRCDAATYVGGAGCIFASVEAVHHLSLAPDDGIAEEAAHVLAAQKTPDLTKPGVPGLPIPGDPDADPQIRKPLTRMFEDYERGWYDANHATAVTTCRNNWGRDCDEYPFRSTYEGAYFTVLYPNAPWSYSARPIDRSQNRRAGALLGAWYTRDHILHGDTFWVKVVGCDGCGGDPDDTPTITWSYQAGADVDPGAVCRFADPASPATTITCTDDGTFTVTLTADDHHGEPAPVSDSATVAVTNVAPTATITVPTPGQSFKAREPVPVTVALTDPGTNDKHTCGATFGDGSPPAAGTVTETDGAGTCTVAHTYGFDGLGSRTIQATVADDDGATAAASVAVVIYVPGHGFALEASGLVTVARTPDVHCPPDQHQSTSVLNTGVGRVDGLAVTCTVDLTIGRTVVDTTIAQTSLLGGLVRISDLESHCTAGAEGITRSSRVGTINGISHRTEPGIHQPPGVATITPGQEIVLANCRLG